MENLKGKVKEHGAVWVLVAGLGYGFGDDGIKAFAADVIKDEVNKELSAEVITLRDEQEKQRRALDAVATEQKILTERVQAGNEKMDLMIEMLRGQR